MLGANGTIPESTADYKFGATSITGIPPKFLSREIYGIPQYFHMVIMLHGSLDALYSDLEVKRDAMLKGLWKELPRGHVEYPGRFTSGADPYWKWKEAVDEAFADHRQMVKETLEDYSETSQKEIWSFLAQLGLRRIHDAQIINVDSITANNNFCVSSWSLNAIFCFNINFGQRILQELAHALPFCKIMIEPVMNSNEDQDKDSDDDDASGIFFSSGTGTTSSIPTSAPAPSLEGSMLDLEKVPLVSMFHRGMLITPNLREWNLTKAWNISTGWNVLCSFYDSGASFAPNLLRETCRATWPNGRSGSPTLNPDFRHAWYDYMYESPVYPADLEKHGTAVISIYCGASSLDKVITGVAPDALWMMFDGMSELSFYQGSEIVFNLFSITRFAEWTIAPSNSPRMGARLTSSSMVCNVIFPLENQEMRFYAEIHSSLYTALYACGITSFIASGNSGNYLSYLTSFAQAPRHVINVGSAYFDTNLNIFMPSKWSSYGRYGDWISAKQAPDFLAPGHDVIVSNTISIPGTGPSLYYVNGTSFSSPSAAGMAALLLAIDPTLTAREIYEIFKITAITPFSRETASKMPVKLYQAFPTILDSSEKYLFDSIVKEGTSAPYLRYPNIFYGNGIINATAAVLYTKNLLNTHTRVPLGEDT